MGGQLDGIFFAGSLPHDIIILIVTSFICLWLILINFSLSLSAKINFSSWRIKNLSKRHLNFGQV